MANHPLRAQGVGKYLAPQDQVIAIRAGQLFDSRSGSIRNNQVVLITGDRISDVGAAVELPTGTRVIDLSSATVPPGMIDTHVHVNTGGTTLGLWKPSCRRDRNGTSQVCHEGGVIIRNDPGSGAGARTR
jgi:imidazolonepropionase-like amidohydrolase